MKKQNKNHSNGMATFLFCVQLIFISGCSSSSDVPKPEAAEIKPKEQVTVDLPQQELLENSKRSFYSGLYSISLDSLKALRDGYSPGPYTEFAELKIGDAQFEMRDYLLSAGTFEEFIKNHPSSRSLSYALLMAGRSFQMANKGVGRDAGPLEKARNYYERAIKEYPESVYAGAAKIYLQETVDKLASYETMVSDFYKKHENEAAANARNEHYETHMKPLVDKTRKQIEEQKSKKSGIDLSKDFTPELVGVNRVSEVSIKRTVPDPNLIAQTESLSEKKEQLKNDIKRYRINSVRCDSNHGSKVFLFLNKEYENKTIIEELNRHQSKNGVISFNLPETSSDAITIDCFDSKDLSISENGLVELKSDKKVVIIAISNPARLLISLN